MGGMRLGPLPRGARPRVLEDYEVPEPPSEALHHSPCIARAMTEAAKGRKGGMAALKQEVMDSCLAATALPRALDDVGSRQTSLRETIAAWRQQAGCVEPSGEIVVAGAVKDQSRFLLYWIVWHLLLGATKVWLYDNESQPASAVLELVAPFVEAGLVELIPWAGHYAQMKAYEDAIGKAKKEGVAFVAVVDVDELVVPFADGCLPALVRRCTIEGGCAGMQLSRRAVYPLNSPGEGLDAATQWEPWSLNKVGLPFGFGIEATTKTIGRASSHKRWVNHHGIEAQAGFCIRSETGDAAACAEHHQFWQPPSGDVAFIYHRHCSTLFNWVVKKSISAVPDLCPTCFGTLYQIAREFNKTCFPDSNKIRGFLEDKLATRGTRKKQRAFMKTMDGLVQRVLEGATAPDGSAVGAEL